MNRRLFLCFLVFELLAATAVSHAAAANDAALWRPRFATPAIVALDTASNRQFVAEIKASPAASGWTASIANDLKTWPCAVVSANYARINNESEPGWRVGLSVPADASPELCSLTVACNESVS